MQHIFHLTERATWEAAQAAGSYTMSTRELTLDQEGYIHASLAHQVQGVAERFYADVTDLVLLVIDPGKLDVPVKLEPPTPDAADEYPHIYGRLPLAAVVEVRTVTPNRDNLPS